MNTFYSDERHNPCFAFLLHCIVIFFKKIAAAILGVVYLLSATETGELFKLPLLAAHYYDHREEGNNTGLNAFLVQHYVTEDGTDKDAAEDSQLPFKSAEQNASSSFVSSLPSSSIEITRPVKIFNHTFSGYKDWMIHTSYLEAIWQPPRNC